MGIFSTSFNRPLYDFMLLLLRITAGCAMLTHGYPKLMKLMAEGPAEFADPIGMGASASLSLAVFAELVCSCLIILGLVTRLAVIPLIITMIVALAFVHIDDAFEQQELAVLYLIIFLMLLVTGAGNYSVDGLIEERNKKIPY